MAFHFARLRFPAGLLAAVAGLGLLSGFILVSPVAGQRPAAAAPAPPRVAVVPLAAGPAAGPAPGGLHSGVQVHGHWTIVVRNPNGTIAAKREFENSLQLDGADALPLLLGGFATPGAWGLYVGNSSGSTGPCSSAAFDVVGPASSSTMTLVYGTCVSVESSGHYYIAGGSGGQGCAGMNGVYACSPNLQVSVIDTANVTVPAAGQSLSFPVAGLQLGGAEAVTNGGTLDTVGTFLVLCNAPNSETSGIPPASITTPASLSPAACESGAPPSNIWGTSGLMQWFFTGTAVPGGSITTVAGQTVQVTVVISFS